MLSINSCPLVIGIVGGPDTVTVTWLEIQGWTRQIKSLNSHIWSNKESIRYVRNLVTETVLKSRYTTNRFQLTHAPFSNGCALQHIKTMVWQDTLNLSQLHTLFLGFMNTECARGLCQVCICATTWRHLYNGTYTFVAVDSDYLIHKS